LRKLIFHADFKKKHQVTSINKIKLIPRVFATIDLEFISKKKKKNMNLFAQYTHVIKLNLQRTQWHHSASNVNAE